MSKPCGTLDLTDKQLKLGIQEYLNQQKAAQQTGSITIYTNNLQEYLAKKFHCIPPFNTAGLNSIVQDIVDQRNKYTISITKSGEHARLFVIGSINQPTATGGLQIMLTGPSEPIVAMKKPVINPSYLQPPKSHGNKPKNYKGQNTRSPRGNKGERMVEEVKWVKGIEQKDEKHSHTSVDLPPFKGYYVPGTTRWIDNDMSEFYYPHSKNPDVLRYQDPLHGKVDCRSDLSCPEYMACDLDRNKCLSTDIIPMLSTIDWNGKRLTGSGRTLIKYLLDQGVPMEDIINKKIYPTYTMRDYIDYIQSLNKPISQAIQQRMISEPNIPSSQSQIIQLGSFTLSTKKWPIGLTIIPDFIPERNRRELYNRISALGWDKQNIQQYGYARQDDGTLVMKNSIPTFLRCLIDILYEYKFVGEYPNQIIVKKYTPGEGFSGHKIPDNVKGETLHISLGSFSMLKMTKAGVSVEIPLIPGSLYIMAQEKLKDWSLEMPKTTRDIYHIQDLKDQSWTRDERISITMQTIEGMEQNDEMVSIQRSAMPDLPDGFKILYQKREPSRNAYVFAVFKNPSYMLGAMPCAYSIKMTESVSDLVCMVTDDIPQDIIQLASKVFDVIIQVPYITTYTIPLRTAKQQTMYNAWKEIAVTKWNCLGLVQYDKVMFVDADKIVLENVEHLFQLQTPAGTWSSPQAQGYSKGGGGMPNPYKNLHHGDIVDEKMIDIGLGIKQSKIDSFVVIGTMVVLSPDKQVYQQFKQMLSSFDQAHPFGFPHCNSMMDEQALVYFYHIWLPKVTGKKYPWTFLGIRYNAIFWNLTNWLKLEERPPSLFHYFNVKPWVLPRREWLDLELWWSMVTCMLGKQGLFNPGELEALKTLYRPDQLELSPQQGCFYCQMMNPAIWRDHQFMDKECNIACPTYQKQLKEYRTRNRLNIG